MLKERKPEKMKVVFLYCLMLCLLQITEQTNNKFQLRRSTNFLPQEDAIGNFFKLLNNILKNFSSSMKAPRSDSCISRIVTIVYKFAIIRQPFGDCSFCCSIENPTNHIRLYFSNKQKRGKLTRLNISKIPGSFKSAGFKRELLTIIYIHGFLEFAKSPNCRRILQAYLNRTEDYNIILVDWENLSAGPWYYQAANNTRIVGNTIADILNFYNKTGEIDLSKVHLIGLSLGAQVAGFVGKHLKGFGHTIGRITGLDPAFPLFSLNDTTQRLSNSDADFVDVIHTNGGMLGFPISIGQADFYPNGGGMFQPECELSTLTENKLIEFAVVCSHTIATEFYAESVLNPKAFPATRCESTSDGYFENCSFSIDQYMGFPANKSSLGDFYLTTDGARSIKAIKEQIARVKTRN